MGNKVNKSSPSTLDASNEYNFYNSYENMLNEQKSDEVEYFLPYTEKTTVWEHGPGEKISDMNAGTTTTTAMQAIEYYSPPPQQARTQDLARTQRAAGNSAIRGRFTGVRASYNERLASRYQPAHHLHHHHPHNHHATATTTGGGGNNDLVYRSNSSLELDNDISPEVESVTSIRREYGSHGSIDVLGDGPSPGTSSSFFALLQDFKHRGTAPVLDQRSPGPARIADVLRGKLEPPPSSENATNSLQATTNGNNVNGSNDSLEPDTASPKQKNKIHRFWGEKTKQAKNEEQPPSFLRKFRGKNTQEDVMDCGLLSTGASSDEEKERQRRRAFAHFDCQSVTAHLPSAADRLKNMLLLRRRNTATGASAASMRAGTPDAPITNGNSETDEETGDGRCNELAASCPYFRNEIGGEEEREVGLTKFTPTQRRRQTSMLHRPPLAYGVSVLESSPGESLWRTSACPYQRPARPIEGTDQGALYYRTYFLGQEHQNWFGLDENLGPVAISIKKEKVEDNNNLNQTDNTGSSQFRVIVRTSELLTLRGAILEDAIPTSKSGKGVTTKELIEYVAPEVQLSCLKLGTSATSTEEQLVKLDEQCLSNTYKVGIMYCKAGQSTEEDMYNNEDAGPAFNEFLETIGQRIRLRGFDKYKAGLDNKTDSTGLYSVYSQYQECEVMFHVSTLLPFTPNNRQQLLRKRHIGNDIVTIVFQEPGAHPFTPKNIRSQFQHVFIIVQVINPCSDNTHYKVAVSRSKDVPVFGPPIPENGVFPRSKSFADFLLAKVINAENAAHRSDKFTTMAVRTKQEYLKDLVANHSTSTAIETSQKFSMLSFSSKKKDRVGSTPRKICVVETWQPRGAIVWQMLLDDNGQTNRVDCLLAVSNDTIVLIDEQSREILFVSPTKYILGWSANASNLRIYYHHGECITLHVRPDGERDELMEVVKRLTSVTPGCSTQELTLRRNGVGQLGFHVQPDGVVTQVEPAGLAHQAGLRQGARLVEICKVAVSTLSHDQMVDLLKTSIIVTVTVIPPLKDGSTRRGCNLPNCKYTQSNYEGDYENVNGSDECKANAKPATFQQAGNHRKRFERSLSPPRSSNSSGYGTGSSSKSFTARDPRFVVNPEGTLTSSSSGHSGDERWYELGMEPSETGDSPPPLPIRLGSGNNSAFHQVKIRNPIDAKSFPSLSEFEQQIKEVGGYGDKNPYGEIRRNRGAVDYVTRTPKLSDFIHHTEHLAGLKYNNGNEVINARGSDTHSTGTNSPSDRLLGARSEDELSAGSGSNLSPRLRRGKRSDMTLTPSSGSSRNQSPRTVGSTTPGGRSDSGEARLRPGVVGRATGSNRNSAILNNSTLQEDLMKLINPDYLPTDDKDDKGNKQTMPDIQQRMLPNVRSRSRENLASNSALSMLTTTTPEPPTVLKNEKTNGEVIFTTARPATVISNTSTASSPAPSEIKLCRDDRISPRVSKLTTPVKLPLPDTREMDWPSLVDTATRAMMSEHEIPSTASSSSSADTVPEAARNGESLGQWAVDVAERWGFDAAPSSNGVGSNSSKPNAVHAHVATLESRVARETSRRLTLEDEVRRLRDENRRLQEESQAAALQLRRFTEWFFQTLDKH